MEKIINTSLVFNYRPTVKLLSSLELSLLVVIFVTGIMNTVLPIEFVLDDNDSYTQEAISSLSTPCSCSNEEKPKTASEALEKSDMVFIGRVIETLDIPTNI